MSEHMKTLALLHTTPVTLPEMAERLRGQGVRVVNLLDDSLLSDVMAAGQVTPAVRARLAGMLRAAGLAGADAALSCCSSVGGVVEELAAGVSFPVLRIDRPMAERAVALGPRVGVLATVATTLEPTAGLIERLARGAGCEVTVTRRLVEGAYQARVDGHGDEHDRLVLAALRELLDTVDVIVLAQASMARLLPALGDTGGVPVLSSPESGVQAALEVLA